MIRELTCIVCPKGCQLKVELDDDKRVTSVEGYTCKRGLEYSHTEFTSPMRTLTTTAPIEGGGVVPVKTDNPVPKAKIFAVMERINNLHPTLPVLIGDVLMRDVVPGVNVVATRNFN